LDRRDAPRQNGHWLWCGDLEGLHSIRVNKQWRLVFQWVGAKGKATNVYLDDHSYQ
jgi:proteic killer suppression protein